MKNRLICLALCLVFVLSVFLTGCGERDNQEALDDVRDANSESARTLTMWLVTEQAMDAATANAVSDKLNEITQSKFKTKLVLNFFTEDEYKTILDETICASQDSKNELFSQASTETDGEEVTVVEETETNEYGFTVTKYPALREHQVDIVYIAGYDMYAEYVNNGWLSSLDSELSSSSKKIKEYISATLLNAAQINNETYAIPNNNIIGEYTYMLLDKELMKECSMDGVYDLGKIDGFFNVYVYNYLETIRRQYGDEILPVDASYDECLQLLAHYWSINPDTYEAENGKFSFLGYRYTDPKTLSKGQTTLAFNSLFADEVFCENFIKLSEYRLDGGYFGEAEEGQRVAIRFATGDLSDYEEYKENYYPVIVKYPSVNVEDVYENMFGVCTYTVDLERSMQIVTYMNTNADFRNILQYGVEDLHYQMVKVSEDSEAERLVRFENSPYQMDLFKTGNAFIAYPDADANMSEDIWEIGKQQNRQALLEPLLNFDFKTIVENTVEVEESTPKTGAAGYVYSYKSGYAKDIISQDKMLKKWIDSCDAAGAGVYVYYTSALSGQNLTATIYCYNNNISGGALEITDADGVANLAYTGTEGGGYDLTVISLFGKKNSCKFTWTATVNGTAVTPNVKYRNALITLDTMKTDTYRVDFVANLTKSMVCENAEVWSFIKSNANNNSGKPFVARAERTIGEEGDDQKKVYTYLFYIPNGRTNPFTATAEATGDSKNLQVNLTFTSNTEKELAEEDPKYAMFLVTVTADVDVAVSFALTVDGVANPEVNPYNFVEDPKVAIAGMLDTELVRFMYSFNEELIKIFNSFKTTDDLDDLKLVVDDLHLLLTPQTAQPFNSIILDALYGNLKSPEVKSYLSRVVGVDSQSMEEFAWKLFRAVSNVSVVLKEEDGEGKVVEVETNGETGEAYTYYDSPYTLYYNWLKENGYVK